METAVDVLKRRLLVMAMAGRSRTSCGLTADSLLATEDPRQFSKSPKRMSGLACTSHTSAQDRGARVRAGALVCTDRPNGAYRPLCGASLTVSNQRPDRALDRTGFALTASGPKQCLADSGVNDYRTNSRAVERRPVRHDRCASPTSFEPGRSSRWSGQAPRLPTEPPSAHPDRGEARLSPAARGPRQAKFAPRQHDPAKRDGRADLDGRDCVRRAGMAAVVRPDPLPPARRQGTRRQNVRATPHSLTRSGPRTLPYGSDARRTASTVGARASAIRP